MDSACQLIRRLPLAEVPDVGLRLAGRRLRLSLLLSCAIYNHQQVNRKLTHLRATEHDIDF